jgi:energy-coupling factor transporter ATP-binding protein EcfA2
MYINKIIIEKFRHLEGEVIGPFDFNSKTSDLIAFAGPNGGGKSSVLELISYALSNSYNLNWSLSRSFSGFAFEVGISLSLEEKRIVISSLNEEIKPAKEELERLIQEIGNKSELSLEIKNTQKNTLIEQHNNSWKYHYDIVDYLHKNSIYYRAFAYETGEYGKNPTLHNQIHSYVTRELKDLLKRSLGFFLRADRNYPQKGFDQNKIFSYENVKRKEHLWTMAFNTSEIQYQDMYEFLVQQRYHYLRELGNFHNQKNKGEQVGEEPNDPIVPYENLLNGLFPHYKFADKNESIPSNLFVEIPSGEVITFNDLSSGEKEVFFILSFFIRHNVENAIIVIDEPELHLHPELSRLLIRNIKSIRRGNQIWVATHNSEIIDEAGRDKVIYVSRDLITRKAKFIAGENEQQVISQLREMFGFSGYIGVAKNLVFLEGDNSSQDRKFYSTLFPGNNTNFKLIPSNSSSNLSRINSAILSIMEANIGWMNFYLIRDRDYLTDEMIDKYKNHSSGNIFVLSKHEIENYLIDFEIISIVLEDIFEIKKTGTEVKAFFYKAALELSSDVIRDMVAFRLNLLLSPQDFSIGKVLTKQPYFDSFDGGVNQKETHSAILKSKFNESSTKIYEEITSSLSQNVIESIVSRCEIEVKEALDSDGWLSLFPGKELIEMVSKDLGIVNAISLQNSLVKELAIRRENIDPEIEEIFEVICTS